MDGDGHGYHHRQKWGVNPLSFLRLQSYISAVPFAATWFLGSQPRMVLKKEQQINICGHSNGRSTAAMVHYSLFMVLCLNFIIFSCI